MTTRPPTREAYPAAGSTTVYTIQDPRAVRAVYREDMTLVREFAYAVTRDGDRITLTFALGQTRFSGRPERMRVEFEERVEPLRRTRVYVAGPISRGDLTENVKRGVEAGMALLRAGFAPMIPHLSCFIEPAALIGTTEYEAWLEHDLAWISVADVLLRLPGDSAGADREVAHALAHNVPVFPSVDDIISSVPATR